MPARTLTLLQRKRLELARALAMQPEAPAARRDRRRADRVRMRRAGQDHQGDSRARHHDRLDRAYRARAGFGGEPADRDEFRPDSGRRRSARGHGRSARARGLHGHPGVMTLLQTQKLSAFYGDFQALFDIDVSVDEGETVAIIGANGAGKTTFLRAVAGALDDRARDGRVRRPADRRTRRRTRSCGSASPWCRKGASCFRACRWRRTSCSAAIADAPGRGISSASTSCFRGCTSCAACRRRRCRAGSSRWRRSAAR